MQWSLFLLILMGQCSFFTCRLYEYHFIEDEKTWEEAQAYCREEYTDLATVYDMTDMERLRDSTDEKHNAWIGLYNIPGQENKEWHWSLPGVEYSETETAWDKKEPNDVGKNENCALKKENSDKWNDVPCTNKYMFICYNETNISRKKFHLINDTMSWPKAQNYCRENHTDLVSGLNQLNDPDLKEQINSYDVWIGLFRDTWRWSDGSHFSFRNWDLKLFQDDDSKKCAMTMLNGKWGSDDCNTTKSFFCYEDEVILIQESKTWEEALNYCTENYRDLVSITNPHQQIWVQEKTKNASTPFVWLGLRYTCSLDLWFWVSDELVCYDNWNSSATTDNCYSAAAMDKGGQHKWLKKIILKRLISSVLYSKF
ncbi:C-type mannose receptor 2-like isoform X2 [Dicentrarchus labrax]|uniref:C-type lectin domain-containing protein n=1 Tax=Dicentrarchus labrax TaxID=13489 RepID=A0A8C4GGQ9_DICLA|nr:C-type mannose receptor 2-like isoform X2 [Dicentrarchus labrax]